jgi:hypothetical protein
MDGITSAIAFLSNLGFAQILLWLATFAIVYGLGKRVFGSKSVSAIIGIVAGFLVLMAVPVALLTYLSTLSTSLMVVGIAIVVILILLELTGSKLHVFNRFTGKINEKTGQPIFEPRTMVPLLIALAVLGISVWVFAQSGGLTFLGLAAFPTIDWSMAIFVIVILGALYWLVTEE